MEENKGKKYKKFKVLMYGVLLLFCLLYFASKTGYYEKKTYSDTVLTKEALKRFEKDVNDGKAVDLKDYVEVNVHNYNNKYSKLGYDISNIIDKTINDGVSWFLKIIKTVFSQLNML